MDSANAQEKINMRFQNSKMIYDGKRMRTLTTRKVLDYSSSYVYKKYFPETQLIKSPNDLIYLDHPQFSPISECITSKFAHISINKHKCPINVLRWTPDGRRLISGTATGELTLWNGFSFNFETILQAHESAIRSMSWAPSGRFLVTGDSLGIIKYWHPSMLNLQILQAHSEPVRDISFCHSDAKFATCSDDGKIKIFDTQSVTEEATLTGHGWDVRVCQWHPYLSLIASGGKDNLIKFWDPRQKTEIFTAHLHRNTILALKFGGSNLFSAGKDQIIKQFDTRMMQEIFTYKGHKKEITSLTVHPKKDDFFVSGGGEGGIYFWQTYDDAPLEIIENGHENTVWCLDFHPVAHVLASGSVDNSVRFWMRGRPEDEKKEISEEIKEDDEKIPGLILE